MERKPFHADIARRSVDVTVNLGDIVSGALQPARMGPSDAYARAQLLPEQLDWIAALPATLRLRHDAQLALAHCRPDWVLPLAQRPGGPGAGH